jgi:predicted nuclease of restriction endonuclease-like (RecB) superfamily
MNLIHNTQYATWLSDLKANIRQRQIKAALAVNSQLIQLYWELGKQLVEKQEHSQWGSGFIDQLSKDLKKEFPDMSGFSVSNLKYCRQFYLYYSEEVIRQQLVGELPTTIFNIPWGHNVLIMQKLKDTQQALFYVQKTVENNWSRAVLVHQIESELYERQGKAVTNFANTLPKPQSDLANQLMKDPYCFDFLQLTEQYNEHDLEKALTQHITQFLLELGTGFSFVGRQYPMRLGEKEYAIDLLFYHLKLRCFVVVELKVVAFQPEFAGKLNFYLNLVDAQLKHETDKPTIGIIVCKTKDSLEAEYALKGIDKPIGISVYDLKRELPDTLKGSLPTIEEIELELNKI